MRTSPIIALALAVLAGSAQAESSLQSTTAVYRHKAEQFARDRFRDARNFLLGPARPAAASPTTLDCRTLYTQRVALTRDRLDYRVNFWDDPRNRAAVFIGSAWSGAFYYLPYSALAAYSSSIPGPQTQAEIDALRAASARQRCFEH